MRPKNAHSREIRQYLRNLVAYLSSEVLVTFSSTETELRNDEGNGRCDIFSALHSKIRIVRNL